MWNFQNLIHETPNNCMCIFAYDLSTYICACMICMIFICWTYMRMYDFDFFRYIFGLQCVISSHVYVIYLFTYRMVESDIVLLYIWSCVWGSIEYSGTQCGNYYLIPHRLTALITWKILDSAVKMVTEVLSMHVAPPAIQTVVVPAGVTVLLGLHNPPRS